MSLEQSLRALAEDDAAVDVPPHVDAAMKAAVMAEWDARARERSAGERAVLHEHRRHRRVAIAWAIAGAIAASLLTIAVLERPRAGDATPHLLQGGATEKSIAPDSSPAMADPLASPARIEQPAASPRRTRPSAPLLPEGAGYVLVPDAGMDAPLTMMRVRMSRSAFSRLGVPIANPDGDGMVDVDVLVGEDGVARSIRRAAAVGWVDDK